MNNKSSRLPSKYEFTINFQNMSSHVKTNDKSGLCLCEFIAKQTQSLLLILRSQQARNELVKAQKYEYNLAIANQQWFQFCESVMHKIMISNYQIYHYYDNSNVQVYITNSMRINSILPKTKVIHKQFLYNLQYAIKIISNINYDNHPDKFNLIVFIQQENNSHITSSISLIIKQLTRNSENSNNTVRIQLCHKSFTISQQVTSYIFNIRIPSHYDITVEIYSIFQQLLLYKIIMRTYTNYQKILLQRQDWICLGVNMYLQILFSYDNENITRKQMPLILSVVRKQNMLSAQIITRQ
eukprot:TRINITY_DN4043_c0_g1_i10.p2 TRINITY_DN4043_c0_g1~~TRINITY_DN4043_c0_g1_i10.p2  ORF type:complete len:297 (+),score=-23.08 TRINITY_DN4043_c0_g1_i10:2736-3626(+)